MSVPICPECLRGENDPPYVGPGIPVRMPGVLHTKDCPTVRWLRDPELRFIEPQPVSHGFISTPDRYDMDRLERENEDLRKRIERLESRDES